MRILVTGSSGTIGTRLVESLLKRGDEVVGIDWVKNKWQPSVDKLTLSIDLRDSSAIAKHTAELKKKPIDAVIHLAANARVYELVEDPLRALDNVTTTFNALELARSLGVKKFIFASSRETYGNIRGEAMAEEMARIENCESPYTASKIGGEAFVHSYGRCYGIGYVIFRFSNVYGAYDDSERVIPLFIRRAAKNELLTVYGKDKCLDFTYIDDCVAGIMLGLDKFDSANGQTINLGTGQGTTILHLAKRVCELKKSTSEMKIEGSRTGEVVRYTADISKAKKLLGYNPKTPFEEGIVKAVEWYAAHS